ncbi:MAG: HDOD domain-containing protein [Sterolibacterium sp.]|jgi:HD-like signal output (HDOD) protein|nr:HDOD domain-containing protein [Sterolibacterium sp.]
MGQISVELSKRLSSAVERMPAFPKSVQRILELTRDINCRPKDLVAVIEKDPVITLKVLKIINSAYYGLPNKITSINQSVIYLGVNTLKNLALSFSTMGMLPTRNAAGFDVQHYLISSLVSANLTRLIAAKYAPENDPTDCYIAGLLHDFGKAVFALYMAPEFRRAMETSVLDKISLHRAEELVIGADHTLVGAMLVKRWQFPDYMVECIAQHHTTPQVSSLGECLFVADLIAEKLGYDSMGNISADGPQVLPERFGADMDALIETLGDMNKLVEDAHMFAQTGNLK